MDNLENKSLEELKEIKEKYIGQYIGDYDKPVNYIKHLKRLDKLIRYEKSTEHDAYKLLRLLKEDDPILKASDEATYSEAQMIAFAIKFNEYMNKENKL